MKTKMKKNPKHNRIAVLIGVLAILPSLAGASYTGNVSCRLFTSNLRFGSKGDEVIALQQVLLSQGYIIRDQLGHYGSWTAAAVTGFQERYSSDILFPWGLSFGTGTVGSATRMKLNSLYGCGHGYDTDHGYSGYFSGYFQTMPTYGNYQQMPYYMSPGMPSNAPSAGVTYQPPYTYQPQMPNYDPAVLGGMQDPYMYSRYYPGTPNYNRMQIDSYSGY